MNSQDTEDNLLSHECVDEDKCSYTQQTSKSTYESFFSYHISNSPGGNRTLDILVNSEALLATELQVNSDWKDSNLRSPGPKPGALAKLRYSQLLITSVSIPRFLASVTVCLVPFDSLRSLWNAITRLGPVFSILIFLL